MINVLNKSRGMAFVIVTAIFTFVPESFFGTKVWISNDFLHQFNCFMNFEADEVNIVISRLVCLIVIWMLCVLCQKLYWRKTIKGNNYEIRIEYGNILNKKNCRRVINFDECFTTTVGYKVQDIKPTSVCGQYLAQNPRLDMQKLIKEAGITPSISESKYNHQTCYESGTLVPNGDDLLMAFAKLDEKGKGRFFSRDEYLECLDLLWKEIENNYCQKDVCIPILGSGITSFDGGSGASIPKQELLDMILWSYKLSSHKIKAPHKLHIVCKRGSDFSLYDIGA